MACRVLLAAAFAIIAALNTPQVAPAQPTEACPDNAQGVQSIVECSCPAASGAGAVWGTDIYTDDSNVCLAARHAGVIGEAGGAIRVTLQPGQPFYRGSARNGVTSADYAQWGRSFAVSAPGTAAAPPAPERVCPATASGLTLPLACVCPPAAGAGNVWGTDIYTDDSNICSAALHAGVIGSAGGAVRVLARGPQQAYRGAARNGIASADYGQWGSSFAVLPPAPASATALAGDWSPDLPCTERSFRMRFGETRFVLLDGGERTAEFEIAVAAADGTRSEVRIARVVFAGVKVPAATIPQPGTVMVMDLSGGRLSVVETRLPGGAVVRPQNLSAYGRCE